jgi:GNAT superfamily N-acetyltransferase
MELTLDHESLLQRFFEANPAYFVAVQGEPAMPNEASEEIAGELPADLVYSRKWIVGYVATDGELAAMANLLSDIFVPSVWNLSTFIVATSRHGTGDGQALYHSLENWMVHNGARWLRLGVVKGYERAERFWLSRGFKQIRERSGYQIGRQVNVVRVMCKPLAGGTVAEYLSLVPRDRPGPQNAF